MVLLRSLPPFLPIQTLYITRIRIYPCPPLWGGFLARLQIYGLRANYRLLYRTQYQNRRTDTVSSLFMTLTMTP